MKTKKNSEFKIGEIVVYPKHGVGEITKIENMEISNIKTSFYVVKMEQSKLVIRVPLEKKDEVGLRKISTKKIIEETLEKNVPLVIGTTGLNNEILENMNKASIKIPIIQAANMSIGVHQLKESIKKFVIENKNKVNCYIEEIHHVKKLDKPSGTAVEIEKLIKRILKLKTLK